MQALSLGLAHCKCAVNIGSYAIIIFTVIVIMAEQEAEDNQYH